MATEKYIVTKSTMETGDNSHRLYSDDYGKFLTNVYNEDGKKIGEVWASWEDVTNDEVELIPSTSYDEWSDAVEKYIKKYNDEMKNATVEYILLEKCDDETFVFQKKVNGKIIIDNSTGLYTRLINETDKAAWLDAVEKYNADHGIKGVAEKIDEFKEDTYKKLKKLDVPKEEYESLVPPSIATAVEKASSDPCKFIEELLKAVANGNTPSLNTKEILEYETKTAKNNTKIAITNARNTTANLIKPAVDSIWTSVDESTAYFKECDAAAAEFKKAHPNTILTFEVCNVDQLYGSEAVEYGGSFTTETDESALAEILGGEITDTSTIAYNDVRMPNKVRGSVANTLDKESHAQNIVDAIKYLHQPMLRAWNTYCKKQGWKTGWIITSGYRCVAYNKAIGSTASQSAHTAGFAIDCVPRNRKVDELCQFVFDMCNKSKGAYRFDQLLNEGNKSGSHWMHLAWKGYSGGQRGQFMPKYDADKNTSGGNVKYLSKS